ncbi:SDR family NAD(P)-dependent oxidoreductase [Chloroflexota bacterium]
MGNLLKGKVAIVTGSGRGIGRAHAIALAAEGAKVVVNDVGVAGDGSGFDKIPADEVVAEIKGKGGEAVANYDSVATSEGAANIIKTATDNFSRLDILVNNAGFHRRTWSWEMTDEEWDVVIKVHLYGTFYCSREAIRILRQQRSGRIINTSSAAGFGMAENSNYSAAKEGIVGLTRALASELGGYGITVNAIRPGAGTREKQSSTWLETRARQVGREEAERMQAAQLQEAPEGCTALVVFLASDIADNVNGCIFRVKMGEVGIYRDPAYVEERVWKKGNWTPEELVELLPKTLTAGKVRELPWGPPQVTSR